VSSVSALASVFVQVSRTPAGWTIHAHGRLASEKRQGTKSRAGDRRWCGRALWGLSPGLSGKANRAIRIGKPAADGGHADLPALPGLIGARRDPSTVLSTPTSRVPASAIMAGREPAPRIGRFPASLSCKCAHDVSIRIATAVIAVGRCLGSRPRSKVSMMIMRPPQHGHGRGNRGSSVGSAGGWGAFTGGG
jgi:hypothetical protein